jgi:ComF family protein
MLKGADYIVPVPLHYRRLLKRRYNQAAIIAHAVAKESGVPCVADILIRNRHTQSQSNFGFKERRKNVRDAFAVPANRAARLAGKKIVLIDDVYTTGATTSECAKALLKAGAEEVHILTIARVAKDML